MAPPILWAPGGKCVLSAGKTAMSINSSEGNGRPFELPKMPLITTVSPYGFNCRGSRGSPNRWPKFRQSLASRPYRPEMAAPILWAPGQSAFFLQEDRHVHKSPSHKRGDAKGDRFTFFGFGHLLVTILSLFLTFFGHFFAYPLLTPPFCGRVLKIPRFGGGGGYMRGNGCHLSNWRFHLEPCTFWVQNGCIFGLFALRFQ